MKTQQYKQSSKVTCWQILNETAKKKKLWKKKIDGRIILKKENI